MPAKNRAEIQVIRKRALHAYYVSLSLCGHCVEVVLVKNESAQNNLGSTGFDTTKSGSLESVSLT